MVLALLLFHPAGHGAGWVGVGSPAPAIEGGPWLNGPAPADAELHGRVRLVAFWTYGCSNCRAVEPWLKRWHHDYAARGLTIIGVHTPEFPHERRRDLVSAYIARAHLPYAVVLDNDYRIWRAWDNHYWPTHYLVDRRGVLRDIIIGEGGHARTERLIETLLAEAVQ